ncbi:glycosyltransferase [Euryarchaeota archaeon]|nr:glycosyltransferase [Euryarchaeota archaeon]
MVKKYLSNLDLDGGGIKKLPNKERVKELLDKEEIGIIRSFAIERLEDKIYDLDAIKLLLKITNGEHKKLILYDMLNVKNDDIDTVKKIIFIEMSNFENGHLENIDDFTEALNRLWSIFTGSDDEKFEMCREIINHKYYQNPMITRDFCLSLINKNSKIGYNVGFNLMNNLKSNLIDDRMLTAAINLSNVYGIYENSLNMANRMKNVEKSNINEYNSLSKINHTILNGSYQDIRNIFLPIEDNKKILDGGKMYKFLERISVHSMVVKNFLRINQISDYKKLETIVDLIRDWIKLDEERLILFDKMKFNMNNIEIDLLDNPSYLSAEIIKKYLLFFDGDDIINDIISVLDKIEWKGKKSQEILQSFTKNTTDLDLGLELLENAKDKGNANDWLYRNEAILFERKGDYTSAIRALEDIENLTTKKLKERMIKWQYWIENGFEYDETEVSTFDYVPEKPLVMYNVHSSLPYVISGYTIRTKYLVQSLIKNWKNDVKINVRWGFPSDRKDLDITDKVNRYQLVNGVGHIFTPDYQGFNDKDQERYVQLSANEIIKNAIEYQPTILHSASDYTIGFATSIAAKKLKIPFVYEMRGLWALSRSANDKKFQSSRKYNLMMSMEKHTALNADEVIVISNQLKKLVIGWGVEKDRIHVLPNCVDLENLEPVELNTKLKQQYCEESTLVLGFIGSIVKYEGLELLIEAISDLVSTEEIKVNVLIIGEGKEKSNLQKKVKEKGLEDIILFLGQIPHDEIKNYYSIIDGIIIPRTKKEVCQIIPSLKPLEAMCMEKLVICSDVEPNKDLIINEENGFLFKSEDNRSLSKLILDFYKNKSKFKEIGKKSRNWVASNRNWNIENKVLIKIYDYYQIVDLAQSKTNNERKIKEIIFTNITQSFYFVYEITDKSIRYENFRTTRNIFLASLRSVSRIDKLEAVKFGEKYEKLLDWRSIKTMFRLYMQIRNYKKAEELIFKHFEKLDKVLLDEFNQKILDVKNNSDNDLWMTYSEKNSIGYSNEYDMRDVLIYSHSNINLIDGSTIWIQSIVTALANSGRKVVFLSKDNIRKFDIADALLENENVIIIQPRDFAIYRELSLGEAIKILEILDTSHGGFRAIICRGLELGIGISKTTTFWNRVFFYFTDFYSINEEGKRVISSEFIKHKYDLLQYSEGFFFQTEQVKRELISLDIDSSKLYHLPPMVPDEYVIINKNKKNRNKELVIGYAGKFSTLWGIRDLIETCEELRHDGFDVKLEIVGNKFNRNTKLDPTFIEDIKNTFNTTEWIKWHKQKTRKETLDILSKVNLIWCFRSKKLEDATLEISTKLIECCFLEIPFIAYSNDVNIELLGKDSPFLVRNKLQLKKKVINLLKSKKISFVKIKKKLDKYKLHEVGNRISKILPNFKLMQNGKKILLNGHDLKFIGELESLLKKEGHQIIRDEWNWSSPKNISLSTKLLSFAEIIISEWGLENAVWYSNNKHKNQKHIVRIHSQEIRQRARKMTSRINQSGCDKIVFVAKHIMDSAIEIFNWEMDNIVMIPNYVNINRFNLNKRSDSKYKLGIVGVVPQSKRVDIAFDIISRLNEIDSNWELIVKGRTHRDLEFMKGASRKKEYEWFEEKFQKLEQNISIKDSVTFQPHSSPISTWYDEIEYVLSLSDWESFHYSVAEGVASGTIPLIKKWEGSDELYDDNWIFESSEEIVEEILRLSRMNDNKIEKIKHKNLNFMSKNYSLEVILEKWNRILL